MPRRISHHRRVLDKTSKTLSSISPSDIIEFSYIGSDGVRNTNLVYILNMKGKTVQAINLNYINEYSVQRLLKETDNKNFRYYSLYKDAFRTYLKSKMRSIKDVSYQTDDMLAEERRDKKIRDKGISENKDMNET
tara:strand:- start:83 stop:487 length:405 start_codon:yes stop_codon:yes gene_type:complete